MFGMNPSGDPLKSAYLMAGLQMLTSNDPSAALQQLPQMIMAAKQKQIENDLEKRKLAISEASLGMEKDKLQLYKDEQQRAKTLQEDKAKFGDIFKKYDLQPNIGGMLLPQEMAPGPTQDMSQGANAPQMPITPMDPTVQKNPTQSSTDWSAADMVTRGMKGDAGAPLGEEGNPITNQMMSLPLAMRQAMANSPITSGETAQPAMTKKFEDVFGIAPPGGTPKAPMVKTLTNGEGLQTLDLNNPQDYQKFQQLSDEGWTEAPTKTITSEQADPMKDIFAPHKQYIVDAQNDAIKSKELSDNYSALGSLLLRDDIYSGAGAPLVNSTLSTLKDTLGVFKNIDFSNPNNAAMFRKEMVLKVREGFQKDSQMSDNDRKFYNDMIIGQEDNKQTIARAIAIKQLSGQVKEIKAEFLADAVTPTDQGGKGMNPVQARKAWEAQAGSIRGSVASEEHVKEIMGHLTEGSKDPSLLNYIKNLDVGGAAQKVEQDLGVIDLPTEGEVLAAPPPMEARVLGQTYNTPKGPMIWDGDGWIPK